MRLSNCRLLIILCFQLIAGKVMSQCDIGEVEVGHHKTASGYSVTLKSANRLENVLLILVDLYTGKEIQKKDHVTLTNGEIEVFHNVNASLYTLYIRPQDCDRYLNLGGIDGIKIGSL